MGSPGTGAPLIVLAGVEKTYYSGRVAFRALRGIDLEIRAGEMVAIVGPSGSGKTTIVNLIAGLDRPSAGTVTVNGTRLDLIGEEQLAIWRRANIGMVFQFFQLMPTLSALDNTLLPMELARHGSRRTREAQARALLSSVGLTSRGSRLPVELSGGEQQRVALARAMACRPRILIGDEPTGNLDSETAREMFGLLADLNAAGTTVIFVTHDPGLAALAPRLVTVRDGRIVSDTSGVAPGGRVAGSTGGRREPVSALSRKVRGDLRRHPGKSLLVVGTLALAIASFAIVAVPGLLNASMQSEVRQARLFDVAVATRDLDLSSRATRRARTPAQRGRLRTGRRVLHRGGEHHQREPPERGPVGSERGPPDR